MSECFLDFESRGDADLRARGLDVYWNTAQPTILTWAVDDDPVALWDIYSDPQMPDDFERVLADESISLIAHNAAFDRTAMHCGLKRQTRMDRWRCTRAMAYAHGLPGSLELLGEVLGLTEAERKLSDGKALIQLFCVPREDGSFVSPYERPAEWETFKRYAIQDTATLRTIHRRIPSHNYRDDNLALWHLDQRINTRGFGFDAELATAAVKLLGRAKRKHDDIALELTEGAVAALTQRDRLLKYLASRGLDIPNMKAATIREYLESDDIEPGIRVLLETRLEASKSSGAKYKKGLAQVGRGNRMRFAFQFSGAGRSGRWSGKGFQPQNLSRPVMLVRKEYAARTVETDSGIREAVRSEHGGARPHAGQDAALPSAQRGGGVSVHPGTPDCAPTEQQGLSNSASLSGEPALCADGSSTSGAGVFTAANRAGSGSQGPRSKQPSPPQPALGNPIAKPNGLQAATKVTVKYELEPVKAKYIDAVILPAIRSGAALALPEVYGGPNEAGALALRHCIVAAGGNTFLAGDWSNIEGRILAWIAGELWKLQAFRDRDAGTGADLYKLLYSRFFGKLIDTINDTERQAGKVVDLSMGFHGGVGAFVTMAAGYGIDLTVLPGLVLPNADEKLKKKAYKAWRRAFLTGEDYDLEPAVYQACDVLKQLYRASSPAIDQIAYDLDNAIKGALKEPGTLHELARCKIWYADKWLIIQLPSGRRLLYADPKLHREVRVDPETQRETISESVSYMVARGKSWFRLRAWSGLFVENIVQGTAADILRAALLRVDRWCWTLPAVASYLSGLPPDERTAVVLHVHDEIVIEVPKGSVELKDFLAVMAESPPWASGLPLAVAGWQNERYGKRD